MSSLGEALAAARVRLPPAEARLVMSHVLKREAAWLITHDETALDAATLRLFASLVARRAGGEPMAYLLGSREFYGREFHVAPGVLIPRPETELLVDIARQRIGTAPVSNVNSEVNPIRVLDMGTGSGCIAISIALECSDSSVTGIDCSRTALEIAAGNAKSLGTNIRLLESDWYSALTGERFDLIVANPPYIATADPHLTQGDLRHEPPNALASGSDGLDSLRQIIAGAPAHLNPDGSLWLEHGYDQAPAVRRLLADAGFHSIEHHRDLAGIERISGGLRHE